MKYILILYMITEMAQKWDSYSCDLVEVSVILSEKV